MVKQIFFIGATGYLGGSVLYGLLQRKDVSEYKFTILTRQESKVKAFEDLGMRVVQGSLDSTDVIQDEVSKADIVISMADCDHVASMKAMCAGMKKYKEQTGHASIMLHTSGTGVLVQDTRGDAPEPDAPIYDDSDPDQIETLADTQPHREVDLLLLAADRAGDCLSYIVLPSTVYGLATDQLGVGANKGRIMNRHSIQLPAYIKLAIKRGQAGTYDKGDNVWPHVHIEDLVKLYDAVFERARQGEGDHGREGFYFGVNGHYVYKDAARAIGVALHKRGKASSTETSPFNEGELDTVFGPGMGWYIGSTGQAKATRARKYGWKPEYTDQDFFRSIDEEIESQLSM